MDYTVVVKNIGETRVLDNNNQPVRAYRFTFTVGTHGPFTMDFSAGQVQDGSARVALNDFARQLQLAAS